MGASCEAQCAGHGIDEMLAICRAVLCKIKAGESEADAILYGSNRKASLEKVKDVE